MAETTRTGRRGILAAAALAVAGIMAQRSAQPVQAASDTNFVATAGNGTAFNVASGGYNTGISATGSNYGVYSSVASGYGVFAVTTGSGVSTVSGVYGGAGGNGNYGVHGENNINGGVGVYGTSASGTAMRGDIPAFVGLPPMMNTAPNTVAVRGVNNSIGAGSVGVLGTASSGIGVYGSAASGYGVVGYAPAGAVAALYGSSSDAGAPAFAAFNAITGGLAGTFNGKVYINGDFVVAGGGKSAAVPHPDGTHRLLYCMESPESWFEDFGEGTLVGGKAEVKLDPDFAAVVDTSTLHVFLTPHGDGYHLNLAGRTATGFTVGGEASASGVARGVKASDLSGTFSYRMVAKRKDVQTPRLAKYDVPKIPPPPPVPPAEPKPMPPLPTK